MTTGNRFAHNRMNNPDNQSLGKMSLDELLRKTVSPGRSRLLCSSLLRGCCPGIEDLNDASALWFLVMLSGAGGFFEKFAATFSKKRFYVKSGFEQVVDTLEQKIVGLGANIRRSEKVIKIENNERAIYVTTAKGNNRNRFKSECVIIAVPPPTNANIIAETKLPENFLESQRLYEKGKHVFFRAAYGQKFWTANSFVVEAAKEGSNLRIVYDSSHGKFDPAVLGGYSTTNNPHQIVDALKESLGRFHGTVESTSCETSDVTPLYFLRPCSLKLHANPMLTSSPAQRVHLAASEFASQWPGTVDGAVEAGERAARAILSRTRPQALGVSDVVGGPSYVSRQTTRCVICAISFLREGLKRFFQHYVQWSGRDF